jgi:hypothetical protein
LRKRKGAKGEVEITSETKENKKQFSDGLLSELGSAQLEQGSASDGAGNALPGTGRPSRNSKERRNRES